MQLNQATDYANGWKAFLDIFKRTDDATKEWIETRLQIDVKYLRQCAHLQMINPANILSYGGCKVKLPKEGILQEAYKIVLEEVKGTGLVIKNQSVGIPCEFEVHPAHAE
jgi:hypothetical protein